MNRTDHLNCIRTMLEVGLANGGVPAEVGRTAIENFRALHGEPPKALVEDAQVAAFVADGVPLDAARAACERRGLRWTSSVAGLGEPRSSCPAVLQSCSPAVP